MTTAAVVDARKQRYALKDVLDLLKDIGVVYACKGRTVEYLDLRGRNPDPAEVARLLLGPTGNLRAPAFRIGRTLLVGFDETTYREVLG